jgi:hypothetical protein
MKNKTRIKSGNAHCYTLNNCLDCTFYFRYWLIPGCKKNNNSFVSCFPWVWNIPSYFDGTIQKANVRKRKCWGKYLDFRRMKWHLEGCDVQGKWRYDRTQNFGDEGSCEIAASKAEKGIRWHECESSGNMLWDWEGGGWNWLRIMSSGRLWY